MPLLEVSRVFRTFSLGLAVPGTDSVQAQSWRLLLAVLVAFSHLQFSLFRGRQPYLIVRNIPYVIQVSLYNEVRPHSAIGDRTPSSLIHQPRQHAEAPNRPEFSAELV